MNKGPLASRLERDLRTGAGPMHRQQARNTRRRRRLTGRKHPVVESGKASAAKTRRTNRRYALPGLLVIHKLTHGISSGSSGPVFPERPCIDPYERIGVRHINARVRAAISEQLYLRIAATFAVGIASHLAGDRLNLGFRIIRVLLHASACAVFLSAYLRAVGSVAVIAGQMPELGNEFGPRSAPVASILRRLVMLVGSLLAIARVFSSCLKARNEAPHPDS